MKKIFCLAFIAILASCSSPLDNKYSDETVDADIEAITEAKVLDNTEIRLLTGYIILTRLFKGSSLDGKSYSQILEEAKAFDKERKGKKAY